MLSILLDLILIRAADALRNRTLILLTIAFDVDIYGLHQALLLVLFLCSRLEVSWCELVYNTLLSQFVEVLRFHHCFEHAGQRLIALEQR